MKKVISILILLLASNSSFAEDEIGNNFLMQLFFNDLKVWVEGGVTLINWSSFTDRDKLISKNIYAPHVMFHEFDENVFAASKKYNQTPILLKGIVYGVSADRNNDPVVSFSAGYGGQFEALGFELKDVENLKRGQQFQFVCYQFHYNGITLGSANCTTTDNYYNLVSTEIFNNRVKRIIEENVPMSEFRSFNISCNVDNIATSKCKELLVKIINKNIALIGE